MSRSAPLLHADDRLLVTVWGLAYDTANEGTNVELFRSEADALNRWLDLLGVEQASVRRRFKRSWKGEGDADTFNDIQDEYRRDPCDTYQLDSQTFTVVTPKSWEGRTKYFTLRGRRTNTAGTRGSRTRSSDHGVLSEADDGGRVATSKSRGTTVGEERGPKRSVPVFEWEEVQEALR